MMKRGQQISPPLIGILTIFSFGSADFPDTHRTNRTKDKCDKDWHSIKADNIGKPIALYCSRLLVAYSYFGIGNTVVSLPEI